MKNKLELRVFESTNEYPGEISLASESPFIRIFVDNIDILTTDLDRYKLDLYELERSIKNIGLIYPYICSCGHPGHANPGEFISQKNNDLIIWEINNWTKQLNISGNLTFDFNEYSQAILNAIEEWTLLFPEQIENDKSYVQYSKYKNWWELENADRIWTELRNPESDIYKINIDKDSYINKINKTKNKKEKRLLIKECIEKLLPLRDAEIIIYNGYSSTEKIIIKLQSIL